MFSYTWYHQTKHKITNQMWEYDNKHLINMPTSSTSSMSSNGHKLSLRSNGSSSPSPSLCSLSPKSSLSYRSTSLSPKTSIINGSGYNGNGYHNYGNCNNGILNSSGGYNSSPGQNGSNHSNGNSPHSVKHNSCILVNGGERKLSNSYLRFQRRYSKHGWAILLLWTVQYGVYDYIFQRLFCLLDLNVVIWNHDSLFYFLLEPRMLPITKMMAAYACISEEDPSSYLHHRLLLTITVCPKYHLRHSRS